MTQLTFKEEIFEKFTAEADLVYWIKKPIQITSETRVFIYVHGLISQKSWFESAECFKNDYILYVPRQPVSDVNDWREWVENLEMIYQHATQVHQLFRFPLHGVANCFGTLVLQSWAQIKKAPLASLNLVNPPLFIRKSPFSQAGLKILLGRIFQNTLRFKCEFSDRDFFGTERDNFIEQNAVQYFSGRFLWNAFCLSRYFKRNAFGLAARTHVYLSSEDRIVDYARTLRYFSSRPKIEVSTLKTAHYVELSTEKEIFWQRLHQFTQAVQSKRPRIAVVGLGSIGAPVAESFLQTGAFVKGITRSPRKTICLREKNLARKIHILSGPMNETDTQSYDLVIFCLKNPDLKTNYQHYLKLLKPQGRALFLGNGLMEFYELNFQNPEQILSGVISCSHLPNSSGEIEIHRQARMAVGSTFKDAPCPDWLAELLSKTKGFRWNKNIRNKKWKKFLFSVWANPLTAIRNTDLRNLLARPDDAKWALGIFSEVLAIKLKEQRAPDWQQQTLRAVSGTYTLRCAARLLSYLSFLLPPLYTSMAHDIQSGRESEIDSLLGWTLRRGIQLQVKHPYSQKAYTLLQKYRLPKIKVRDRISLVCQA